MSVAPRVLSQPLRNQYVSLMNRHLHNSRLIALLVAVTIGTTLSAGFPTRALGQQTEGGVTPTKSRSVITTAEIQKYGANGSVHDLINALRRQWLNVHHTSIRETPIITAQGKRGAEVTPARDATLLVYLDRIKVGDIDQLRSLPLAGVVTVRYYNPAEALRRWGSGHEHGAVEVITTPDGGIP